MSKRTDIDELLVRSQRLRTHDGYAGVTGGSFFAVSHGVSELTEFSKQWNREASAHHGVTTDPSSNMEAFRMLSQKNFDAKKLLEDVNSIHVKVVDDSTARLEGTDIDGYLAHHHDMIILTAIDEARHGAEDHVHEMQRRWAAHEWSEARTKFMESLGHRAYRWEGQAYAGIQTNGGGIGALTPAAAAAAAATPAGSNSAVASRRLGAHTNGLFTSPVAGGSAVQQRQLHLLETRRMEVNKPLFSKLCADHTKVVAAVNRSTHQDAHLSPTSTSLTPSAATAATAFPVPAYSQLADSVRIPGATSSEATGGGAAVSDGLNKAELLAYRAHLQLLASIVGETHVRSTGSGTSSGANSNGVSCTIRQVPVMFISTGSSDSSGSSNNSFVPPGGYFASICLDPTEVMPNAYAVIEARRQWLTRGVKSYLEAQWWDVLTQSLDEAVYRDGWTLPGSHDGASRTQRLRSYVSYRNYIGQLPAACAMVACPATTTTRGTASPSGITTPPTPLWVFIFQCLRVGDISAASDELNLALTQGHVEGGAAVWTVLQRLSQLLASSSSSTSRSGGSSSRTPTANSSTGAAAAVALSEVDVRSLVDAIQQCRIQYERELKSDDTACDPYGMLIFNLLGLVDKEALASTGIPSFSLEDFLWAHMWFIDYVRVLQLSLGSAGGILANCGSTNERGLFELILEYGGAEYFDEDRSNPFRYAMVLCCCQRYGDAIMHLWQCNKVFPAVHLCVLALHYGLILPHVPLNMNPPHPMVMGGRYLLGGAHTAGQEPSPTTLLQFYANTPLLRAYPGVAVDYLVSLDAQWYTAAQQALADAELKDVMKAKSQSTLDMVMESFISALDRQQLTEVLGKPLDNQSTAGAVSGILASLPRTQGRLDSYFTVAQIDQLLSRTAYHLLTQRREVEAAIHLYLLAGRYAQVCEELCHQLAAVLIPLFVDHPVTTSAAATPTAAAAATTTPAGAGPRRHLDRSHDRRRNQWRSMSESFIENYLQAASSGDSSSRTSGSGSGSGSAAGTGSSRPSAALTSLQQGGGRLLVDSLLVLTGLFSFVDAVYSLTSADISPLQALRMLDDLQILPCTETQLESMTAVNPYLQPIIDDLLLMSVEATTQAYYTLHAERMRNNNDGAFVGLVTEQDLQLQALKLRAHVLYSYAHRNKSQLNRPDTAGILARTQATL